jgi:5-oxoprolinase (ATP-hydrolysing)
MPGAQRLVRATGETVSLGPLAGCEVGPGDRLIIETPGGGAYGRTDTKGAGAD